MHASIEQEISAHFKVPGNFMRRVPSSAVGNPRSSVSLCQLRFCIGNCLLDSLHVLSKDRSYLSP